MKHDDGPRNSRDTQSSQRVTLPERRAPWIVLALLWVTLALAFGRLDLAISRAAFDPRSPLAVLVERYGEIPGYLLILAAVLILDLTRTRSPGASGVARSMASLLVASFVAYLLGAMVWYRLSPASGERGSWALLPVVLLAGVAARSDLGAAWSTRVGAGAVRWARDTALLAAVDFVAFVQVAKRLWGRVRFRDLDPGFADFTPWFVPRGPGGIGSSFASGHTALGWMLLPLVLAAVERGASRRVTASVALVAVAWGVIVATGRVVAGAHYASDVLFPTGVAWAFVLLRWRAARPPAVTDEAR
ncbi:MAG: phosphatase PAP2 family protein [Deltaproteobacteria bacterium]|nr:phosphatase PAP2 family protein [Myxococcales bacterium]MDP3214378.1 phosphatase PAP2 family protein [Deltaproteobacteria bacterium]